MQRRHASCCSAMKLQRWAFLRELIPLAVLLMVLEYSVVGGRLLTGEPSPLWLLVLLIAPRRGSLAGFVCGLAAAAIYLWCMSEQGHLWQDMLHRQPSLLIEPGLFLLFGVYLGALGESQTRRMEHFRDKALSLAAQLDSCEIQRTELERSRIAMEKRIAGQGATLLTLHDSFKRLGRATSEEDLLRALESLLREESRAESCGIWRISQGGHRLVCGRSGGDIPAIAVAVGKNHKVLSAADWSRKSDVPPGADLAALVRDAESERLVIALAGCPFVRLTRDLALRIGLLAEQAGLVLEALRNREILRRQAALDTESGLVSETYLRRRVNEETALAVRHKTPLSLLACSITGHREKTRSRLETALSCSIRACIRFSDGLAWFRNERAFVIVLPQCDERGAAIVLKKIESNLEMLELRDARNQAVYELAWSIHACDGTLKGDAVFARLFADMRREARA